MDSLLVVVKIKTGNLWEEIVSLLLCLFVRHYVLVLLVYLPCRLQAAKAFLKAFELSVLFATILVLVLTLTEVTSNLILAYIKTYSRLSRYCFKHSLLPYVWLSVACILCVVVLVTDLLISFSYSLSE